MLMRRWQSGSEGIQHAEIRNEGERLTLNPAVGDVPRVPCGGEPAKFDAGRLRVFGGIGILAYGPSVSWSIMRAENSRSGRARGRDGLSPEFTGRSRHVDCLREIHGKPQCMDTMYIWQTITTAHNLTKSLPNDELYRFRIASHRIARPNPTFDGKGRARLNS